MGFADADDSPLHVAGASFQGYTDLPQLLVYASVNVFLFGMRIAGGWLRFYGFTFRVFSCRMGLFSLGNIIPA